MKQLKNQKDELKNSQPSTWDKGGFLTSWKFVMYSFPHNHNIGSTFLVMLQIVC